jgi:phage gpG-like protein
MAGVALEIVETGLTEAILKIEGIADAPRGELMEGIGRLVQGQTRRRIETEKTSPAGAAWKPNRAGTSILYRSGALARSIDYAAADDSVQVGSALVYAGVHQGGAVIVPKTATRLVFHAGGRLVFAMKVTIPARPFVGLSADNQNEIVETAEEWLERLVQ